MEELIRKLLEQLGEDPDREGLERTPARVASSLKDLTSGHGTDAEGLLRKATFASKSTGIVVCKDIDFVSLCEHHMLPFVGKATIAYEPDGVLVGISKLVRAVEAFSRRLQVQERMGQQILDSLNASLHPRGAFVRLEALHLCMVARGVKQPNAHMVTVHASGTLKEKQHDSW